MKRLGAVVGLLVVALVGSLLVRVAIVESEEPLVVVHWSNSHPLREDLLQKMADEFNDQRYETASGQPIEIKIVKCESAVQAEDVVARITGSAGGHECEADGERADDPMIVTPQSDDWLVDINHYAARNVIDLEQARGAAIAKAYLGIVTSREAAECLRASRGEIGYADLLELADKGWKEFLADGEPSAIDGDCPLISWGDEPRLSYTNPSTSTSGRNVLVTLYAMYADEEPIDLDEADIDAVQTSVQAFQTSVDHYLPTTAALNRKIAGGIDEGGGDFFLMPEDNVVSLFKGNETVPGPDGTGEQPVEVRGLEMIYPEEGSVLNSNPAALVDAGWVSPDELAAATRWIDYLRADEQQEDFMAAGFRPGTDLEIDADQFERWGLDARPPTKEIDPGRVKPDVLEEIIGSWGAVRKPSVVTFVVDVSSSMKGDAIKQVKEGLRDIVDEMQATGAATSRIGLVTFNDEIQVTIPPETLGNVGDEVIGAINSMDPTDETALYDALQLAIQLTDSADAPPEATRAVVVLSDGETNRGQACLDDIVEMGTEDHPESPVVYCAKVGPDSELDVPRQNGDGVTADHVIGLQLNDELNVQHDNLKVFFLGFGSVEPKAGVGRILARATNADVQGSPEEDLAAVILTLSGYF